MKNKNHLFKLIMVFLAVVAFVALSSIPAFCEDLSDPNVQGDDSPMSAPLVITEPDTFEPEYGIADLVSSPVSCKNFNANNATTAGYIQAYGAARSCSSGCWLYTNVTVPTGARIYGMNFHYYDAGSSSITMRSYECPGTSSSCNLLATMNSTTTSGWVTHTYYGINKTANNYNNVYELGVYLPGGNSYALHDARLLYYLQVSPAPGSATFYDVPTYHPFFRYVEALARSGITSGCGGGAYCPDSPVTRGQMAVFLSKALGLHWPY